MSKPNAVADAIYNGLSRVAHSITVDAPIPGVDAAEGHVASLTEAVMGVTAGLCRCADAPNRLADAAERSADEQERLAATFETPTSNIAHGVHRIANAIDKVGGEMQHRLSEIASAITDATGGT